MTNRHFALAVLAILTAGIVAAFALTRPPAKQVHVYTPTASTYVSPFSPEANAARQRKVDEAVEKSRQRMREDEQDYLNFMLRQRLQQDEFDALMRK